MSDRSDPPGNHTPPTPNRSVQRLGALVGRWRTEGHIVAEPPIPVTGTDIYEWLPGSFFLVHHVDVMIQDQPVQAIEIIGELDQSTGSIIGRAYDNRGDMTILYATVDAEGVWTFTGGADIAPVAQPSTAKARGAVRSTLTVSPDRSGMTAMWERSDNGIDWEPWMDIRFTRMPEE